MKRQNIIYYSVLVALMLFYAIYTITKFPYTYITMEGDDFWVQTWGFWQLKLATLPAFTSWISDFLMQFYRSPYIGAAIQTLVLGLIGVFAHRVLRLFFKDKGFLAWLGLLPPILLGYYCTFDLSFQLQCLFLFAFILIYHSQPESPTPVEHHFCCTRFHALANSDALPAPVVVRFDNIQEPRLEEESLPGCAPDFADSDAAYLQSASRVHTFRRALSGLWRTL